MDAQYLKNNVNDALTEALTSMAVALPEDGIEYIGRYLLQYVERRKLQKKMTENYQSIQLKANEDLHKENLKAYAIEQKKLSIESKMAELDQFISKLSSIGSNKQDAMNSTCEFLAQYLQIPAVYVAIKKVSGDSDTLNYLSANSNQERIVVGKKIKKSVEEGDDLPPRQGMSFDAFKIPPQEETEEPTEGEDSIQTKPPPVPLPVIVDNVMRDNRIQFFGVPKLGSYVAVPFLYNSCDHATGIQEAQPLPPTEEGGAPIPPSEPFVPNVIPVQFIIAGDTIGAFRRFTISEIEIIKSVGNALVERLQAIERDMFKAQVNFLSKATVYAGPYSALTATLADEEALAVSSALSVASSGEPVGSEDAPKPDLPAFTESVARATFYTQKVILPAVTDITLSYQGYILPPPISVMQLFYAVACLCGVNPSSMNDACGDLSWEKIKTNFILNSPSLIHLYNPTVPSTVSKDGSCASVRAFCDTNNIFDTSGYPAVLYTLPLINAWLQKNLAAREAVISYYKETKNENIETIV
jgi:hypothetical protein